MNLHELSTHRIIISHIRLRYFFTLNNQQLKALNALARTKKRIPNDENHKEKSTHEG